MIAGRSRGDGAARLWAVGTGVESCPLAESIPDAADAQMDHFQQGEEEAEEGHDVHHQQEDGLLSRAGHEAVHRVGARGAAADVRRDHLEAVEDVLAEEEGHLEGRAPKQLANVDLHQAITQDPPPTIVLFFRA